MSTKESAKPSAPRINEKKVRLIHVARRQLGLTEEDYRSVLGLFGGVETAAELDQAGFTAVMDRLTKLGFKSTSPRRPLAGRAGIASPAQVAFMRQLWADCTANEGTEADLGKWLERQFKVSSVRFVTADLARQVIGGLQKMKANRKARAEAASEPSAA